MGLNCPANADESPDPQAASALAEAISDISEECWCAWWLIDCEHSLWRMLTEPDRDHEWGMGIVSVHELGELRALSERCKGWVRWRDAGGGEWWEPVDAWVKRHEAYERHLAAWAETTAQTSPPPKPSKTP